jgi:hypothetical protein
MDDDTDAAWHELTFEEQAELLANDESYYLWLDRIEDEHGLHQPRCKTSG